ncbi:phage tail protein [Bradyrhizobium diazoefficiens]|uniref:phage tail protein n=1 Tax=Bradyrhizobium diazoefficiens TaxID=1355477 RepID=UPI000BE9D751|nr:tail fiber protein [Bradyrhizobium diazoefficiens]PDT58882.1 phage tail protein [Bradyrhizobium diazoefficiens]
MTGVAWWSQTASNNATQDSNINWAEGQAPSSVNDSARSMMASTARWRDDISGAITTGGTSTAYTVSSNQSFDSLSRLAGQVIAFTPHTTNTAGSPNVTLNVDGLGAKSIQVGPNVEIPAGFLVSGSPYVALYNATNGVFYLQNSFGNPYNIPIGGMIDYTGAVAPNSSFVLPFGQAISRTTYAAYFALVGAAFGAGDGTSTFNVPDLRGRVVAGKDDMGGSAASRLTSSYFGGTATTLGAVGGGESHTLTVGELPPHYHDAFINDPGHVHQVDRAVAGEQKPASGGNPPFASNTTVNSSTATTGVRVSSSNGLDKTGNTGSGSAHAIVQPTIVLSKILRII